MLLNRNLASDQSGCEMPAREEIVAGSAPTIPNKSSSALSDDWSCTANGGKDNHCKSFHCVVGKYENGRRDRQTKRSCSLEIDNHLELGR
jgi:hypothetical protein